MRSVVVVLPASMWAMIPILRTWASGISRADEVLPLALDLLSFSATAI
ncbi:unannotated protein [freshwater metagenome]|uniref:Unannotated protein n=1 Tax=freshwater metagenome TaxID=449393 RepID=A0A6J6RG01_9ZZZZ